MKAPLFLIAAAVGVGAIRDARAQQSQGTVRGPLDEGAVNLSLQAGWLSSRGSAGTDMDAASGRIGLGYTFRDSFEVVGELDGTYFDQDLGAGSKATSGVGVAALLRWHALRGEGWSAYLEGGLGLTATEEAIPVGGTRLNGTRQAGAGMAFDMSERWRLTLGFRQQHLSNGRGLGSGNPSWDGFGGYLGVSLNMSKASALPAPVRPFEPVPPWVHSTRIEARLGELGNETGGGVALALDSRLVSNLHGQLRASIDTVDGEELLEAGLALYMRGEGGLIGLAFDHQDLDAFEDDEVSLFGELYANDLVTVTGVLGNERRNHSVDRVVGGVALRLYLLEGLMVEAGIAARDPFDSLAPDSVEVPLGIEYSPLPMRKMGLSVFAEDGLNDEARVIGLRWTLGGPWGEEGSLRDRDRSAGPRRTRF